jgi:hypothetical protein
MDPANHVFLFIVSDHFGIEGRGVVVIPGIPDTANIRKGEMLVWKLPSGEMIESSSWDTEIIAYRPGAERLRARPICLRGISKLDIPIGTEVFLKVG